MVERDLVASGFETRVTRRISTSGAETFYPSGAPEVILSFCPISFENYIVCYSVIDLRLLVTSCVSSDVSHYNW